MLRFTAADLGFYEVGCELGKWTRSGTSLKFDAQCYKGGDTVRSGKVVLRRHATNRLTSRSRTSPWRNRSAVADADRSRHQEQEEER